MTPRWKGEGSFIKLPVASSLFFFSSLSFPILWFLPSAVDETAGGLLSFAEWRSGPRLHMSGGLLALGPPSLLLKLFCGDGVPRDEMSPSHLPPPLPSWTPQLHKPSRPSGAQGSSGGSCPALPTVLVRFSPHFITCLPEHDSAVVLVTVRATRVVTEGATSEGAKDRTAGTEFLVCPLDPQKA